MTAAQDAALQGGAIVLAFASYSMATDVALALVIVLALAIVLALQSAIEPNFIPPEIKQSAAVVHEKCKRSNKTKQGFSNHQHDRHLVAHGGQRQTHAWMQTQCKIMSWQHKA